MDKDYARIPSALLVVLSIVMPGIAMGDIGKGRLEIRELHSAVFSNTRNIRTWLPPGYDQPENADRQYPVLYLNDGQDLFDSATSIYFSADWEIDETLSSLIADSVIEPIIVVGIDNAGREERPREYLPYPDEFLSPPEPNPMGSEYPTFIEEEVIPFVESSFRVKRDKSGRTIGGASYGGLIALYVAIDSPQLFGQLLLESPSLYVDDNRVLRETTEVGLALDKVYLGVGTNETGTPDCGANETNALAVRGVKDLREIIVDAGYGADRIKVNIEECATHSPAAWARRFSTAARFLFAQ